MSLPKEILFIVIGIRSSCTFMLPVTTPPNAIVFGTGYIQQSEMMHVGFMLNILCIALLSIIIYLFFIFARSVFP
jgi:sodium-dependent dicarboxylate transporter 2/3/5